MDMSACQHGPTLQDHWAGAGSDESGYHQLDTAALGDDERHPKTILLPFQHWDCGLGAHPHWLSMFLRDESFPLRFGDARHGTSFVFREGRLRARPCRSYALDGTTWTIASAVWGRGWLATQRGFVDGQQTECIGLSWWWARDLETKKTMKYELMWKERLGFARMAIKRLGDGLRHWIF